MGFLEPTSEATHKLSWPPPLNVTEQRILPHLLAAIGRARTDFRFYHQCQQRPSLLVYSSGACGLLLGTAFLAPFVRRQLPLYKCGALSFTVGTVGGASMWISLVKSIPIWVPKQLRSDFAKILNTLDPVDQADVTLRLVERIHDELRHVF
jgi:hypothetical protein